EGGRVSHPLHTLLRQAAWLRHRRECSCLLACRRVGSAVTAGIGAQGLQQRLVAEVALISPALLSLHTHRVGSDCSLLQDSALQPSTRQGVGDLLWPLLTSPLPSLPVAGHLLGTAPREAETSLGKTLILPPVAAGFTNAVSE